MRVTRFFSCFCGATCVFAASAVQAPARAGPETLTFHSFTLTGLLSEAADVSDHNPMALQSATAIDPGQAFGAWGLPLLGQPNSLFLGGEAFSNIAAYTSPTGFTFLRNPEARLTPWRTKHSNFSVALEQSGSVFVDPDWSRLVDSDFAKTSLRQQLLPDITAELSTDASWGHFSVSGIARDLGFEKLDAWNTDRPKGNWAGWGVDISTALNVFDKDQVIAGIVYGRGIANYMNEGGIDLAAGGTPTDPHAVAMPLYGVSAYYNHAWSRGWSSAIGYSFTKVDNAPLQAANAYRMGRYASINLLYSPEPDLAMGGEALWGQRIDHDHNGASDLRLQFSFKYSFR